MLSKDHYCHKIHTLLMKSKAYPLFIGKPLYGLPPPPCPPIFTRTLDSPLLIFQEPQPPIIRG